MYCQWSRIDTNITKRTIQRTVKFIASVFYERKVESRLL